MNTGMKVFKFLDNEIRPATLNGEAALVLNDICDVLDTGNPSMVAARLEEDEKGISIIDTLGGPQEMIVVNEAGFYNVVLLSRKPIAKEFRRWATHEVFPSIRKHGLYAIDEVLENPDMLIQALQDLKAEREQRKRVQNEKCVLEQRVLELQPKASYYDMILNCKDAVSVSTIAKDYGKSAQWLNDYLHSRGVQFRQSHIWLLYIKYAEFGYTVTKTHTYLGSDGETHSKVHTHWTQKGRLFIYDLLKSDGILPLVEQTEEESA